MKTITLASIGIALLALALSGCGSGEREKPNIIFFVVDDLGYSDVGCYGSSYYETPNIDRLAGEGMRFTDAYTTSCVCSPTRASMLTGKYPGRLHITHAIPIEAWRRHKEVLPLQTPVYNKNLPLEEFTVAEALKEAGYSTGFVGKWHVCHDSAFYPQHQGFDVNVAGNNHGGPGDYFYPFKGTWRMTANHPWESWYTLPDGKEGEYLTDRLTDEALAYMESVAEQPFFLCLWHYAVHSPFQAKEEMILKYKDKPGDTLRGHTHATYAAMIESTDQSLGRVMQFLEDRKLADRTIILFTSDNGGYWRATSNYPLRGNKGNFYEGGIRVPAIIKVPGVTKAGSISREPITSTDYYPTLLEMAGLPLMPEQHLDGLSLMPVLENGENLDREALIWHAPNYVGPGHRDHARPCGVVRMGSWKMIASLEDGSVELYNLEEDISEQRNLAGDHPDRVDRMLGILSEWRSEANVQMPVPNPLY